MPTRTPSYPQTERDATFASDNSAGMDHRVAAALVTAGAGNSAAYGDDGWTRAAERDLADHFGPGIAAYLVSTGTAANVLALGCLARLGEQVLAASCAHAYQDEGGSVEALTRCAMRPLSHTAGKVTPATLRDTLARQPSVHESRPRILSLAQATELGTVYSVAELTELCDIAHHHGLLVHLDGARLANTAAALAASLRQVSFGCGVDAVSFGTSKNGTMSGEAALLRVDGPAGTEVASVAMRFQKQLGQLHSKQRFLAVQVVELLRGDVWRSNARAANAAAQRLADGLVAAGATLSYPVQTNAVFAILDPAVTARLRRRYLLLDGWQPGEVRFMTSFATTTAQIDSLLALATATP